MHELAKWLFDQIAITTDIECLNYIGECIAFDKGMDAVYLSDPHVVGTLRRAWADKKDELIRKGKEIEKQKHYSAEA